MGIDRAKPEDIVENSPHGRDEKTDADGSRSGDPRERNQKPGAPPGDGETHPDDRIGNDR